MLLFAQLQAQEAVRLAALRRLLEARLEQQQREQAARLNDTVVGATAETPDGGPVPPPATYGGVVGVAIGEVPSSALGLALEANFKGFEGDACPECGNFTMVRNGTCLKCTTCGGTTGCS